MGAGQFRHSVKVQYRATVPDGSGGDTITWTTLCTEPARYIRAQSFRGDVERVSGGGIGSHPIVQVVVRHNDDTARLLRESAGWRLEDEDTGIVMNIQFSQDMTGRRMEIHITAPENLPA
jgi:head-tail adaptor